MIFLGGFFCGEITSVPCTPTDIADINYIQIENGKFDDLYVTSNTSFELTSDCYGMWEFDTVLYAKFDNNTLAGNVDWSLATVSHVLIKRRRVNDFKWITLYVKDIKSIDDFNIKGYDVAAAGFAEYEYAVVPSLNGIEGNYSSSRVFTKINSIVIADKDEVWSTDITDGNCDTVRNVPSSIVNTLNSRYAVYISNCDTNYDSGTVTASFVEFLQETCEYIIGNYDRRNQYQNKFVDFLSNRKPKMLKNIDGRTWPIMIIGNPTNSADGGFQNRKFTFEWAQIGDIDSEEVLFDLGFINATNEWWNK